MPDVLRPTESDASTPVSDPRVRRLPRPARTPALPLALATATGIAAGALIARGAGGLGSTLASPAPPPTEMGIRWSPTVTTPEAAFRAAVDALGVTVGALGLATTLVALAAAATLLVAVGSLRRRELAVRGALGRGPWRLAALLARRDGALLLGGVVAGTLAGVAGAALLHGTWPVERPGGSWVPTGPTALATGIAVALCGGLALTLTLLPARYGVRDLSRSLAAGSRSTADPREGGLRRIATVFQTAASLALLSASLLLWQALPDRVRGNAGPPVDDEVVLLSATLAEGAGSGDGPRSSEERAARYGELLDRLGSLPTVASESIASPGAWTGVATSDFVLADCGTCYRGMFWLPFLGEEARHHAVSPGFFESAGMELLDGRDFTLPDGPGAEPVAVVTEPMARKNFEDGDPLGRRVRIGEDLEGWYTVVGVVRERRPPGLGLPDQPPHGVYLSALQHPPDRVEVGFRVVVRRSGQDEGARARRSEDGAADAAADAVAAVRAASSEAGLVVAPGSRTSSDLLGRQADPLRWGAGAAGALGLIALVSALLGVHRVAAVEVAARRRELGIRLALGATAAGITRWVLGRTVRSTLLGALLAVPPTIAVAARLRETLGDIPLFDLRAFAGLAALLVGSAVAGAWGPARRAAGLEPALVMTEE